MQLRDVVKRWLPRGLRTAVWTVRRELLAGGSYLAGHECPICGNRRRFLVVNREGGRSETLCMRCHSLERHRRTIIVLRRHTDLFAPAKKRVLHIAPEACLRRVLEAQPHLEYVTGDLEQPDVDVRLDVTRMPFPDQSFDALLCSHVLEHVPDDRAAMREMRRVVKDEGWALINVPADPAREQVDEDSTVADPDERMKRFGQADHVRVYAVATVLERLEEAGFSVDVDPVAFTSDEQTRCLLDGDIGWDHSYFCRSGR